MAKTDLLLSEDFHEFIKLMVAEGHGMTKMVIDGNVDPIYFKGAMEMFRRMVKIPGKMAENETQKEMAGALIARAFNEFEAKLLRSYFNEDES